MTYKLRDGTRVQVTSTDNEGEYDFKLSGPAPEKKDLGTYRKSGEEADRYIKALAAEDALRFARQYRRHNVTDQPRSQQMLEERAQILMDMLEGDWKKNIAQGEN